MSAFRSSLRLYGVEKSFHLLILTRTTLRSMLDISPYLVILVYHFFTEHVWACVDFGSDNHYYEFWLFGRVCNPNPQCTTSLCGYAAFVPAQRASEGESRSSRAAFTPSEISNRYPRFFFLIAHDDTYVDAFIHPHFQRPGKLE